MNTWQTLIKPAKVDVKYSDPLLRDGTIIIEPLERGFGTTIGNSLRRILLSSIRGSAIVAVKIEGVAHEFSTISGVREDVPEIILNLKALRFKYHGTMAKKFRLSVSGPKVVTASDIQSTSEFEVMDPDHVICTLDADASLNMELFIDSGTGYVSATSHEMENKPIGVIEIDSIFSPVKLVDFKVEPTRVGKKTDFDQLILRVVTDGSIRPDDAVSEAARILKDHFTTLVEFEEGPQYQEEASQGEEMQFNKNLFRKVDELELSVRSANCMKNENIFYVGDLIQRTEADMLKTPNFGRKSLNEIKLLLQEMDLNFGMNIPNWPPENLDELAKKIEEQYN